MLYDSESLTNVEIPDSVKRIPVSAIYYSGAKVYYASEGSYADERIRGLGFTVINEIPEGLW